MIELMERRGVIDMRKRFIPGNGDTQERAEWLPPLLDVEDQQPLRGNRLAHCLHVSGKDGFAMGPIGEPIVERAGVDDVPGSLGPLVVPQGKDRGTDTVVPAPRIADGENDLGIRVRRGQLFPEVRPRPIDDGLKSDQEWPPIDRLAGGFAMQRVIPQREPLLMFEILHYVVARAEPQADQCLPHRQGTGPA